MATLTTIRLASATDLDAIWDLEHRCFGQSGDSFSPRQLSHLVLHAQGACYVAVTDDRVVGYISLLTRCKARNVRIYSISVDPLSRGKGVGQALVERAISFAHEGGYDYLSLEVRTDNQSAIELYLRNGFSIFCHLQAYYHDQSDGIKMKKQL